MWNFESSCRTNQIPKWAKENNLQIILRIIECSNEYLKTLKPKMFNSNKRKRFLFAFYRSSSANKRSHRRIVHVIFLVDLNIISTFHIFIATLWNIEFRFDIYNLSLFNWIINERTEVNILKGNILKRLTRHHKMTDFDERFWANQLNGY